MPEYDLELYTNKKMKTDVDIAKKTLALSLPALESVSDWSNENLFEQLKNLAAANELKNGQILYPARIALSGKATTPGGATELAVVLGKAETLNRLHAAIAKLVSDKGNHNIQLLSVNETFTLEDIISTDWEFFNVNQ